MKINKLLFFLLALVSLNSCVEYVDNGTKPDGPETPEPQNFTAKQSNTATATKVGDTFEFKAELNNVDVTASTKFKVNGVDAKGNTYIPFKEGSHAVIATYNNLTANFKFTVEAKDTEPEPEPTGNRIEYQNKSYPVDQTMWILHVKDGKIQQFKDPNGVIYTLWAMISYSVDANDDIVNMIQTYHYVALKNNQLAFPHESTLTPVEAGSVIVNGTDVFDIKSSTYTFASSGNTVATQSGQNYIGTGNYVGNATSATSASAKIFWNGNYNYFQDDLMGGAKSAKSLISTPKKLQNIKF